nr:MAG TPA: hypothetical protein [Caudoviricetes sp.]
MVLAWCLFGAYEHQNRLLHLFVDFRENAANPHEIRIF